MLKILKVGSLVSVICGMLAQTPNPTEAASVGDELARINRLDAKERAKVLATKAREEKTLTWYSASRDEDVRHWLSAFNKHYPFIEVGRIQSGGRSITDRLLTEHRAKQHKADLVDVGGIEQQVLVNEKIIAPYCSPERKSIGKQYMDERCFITGIYYSPFVIGYNTQLVQPKDVPRNYEDLADPKWKGKLVMDSESFDWFAGLIETRGRPKAVELGKKLAANNLTLRRGHTLVMQLLAAGEFAVSVEQYLHNVGRFKERGAPVEYVVTKPTLGRIVNGIMIANNAPHPYSTVLLYDFLLSEEAQQILAGQGRGIVRRGIKLKYPIGDAEVHVPSMDKWSHEFRELAELYDQVFRPKR